MANDVGVVGDYVELGVGYLDVPGLFLLLGLFEFLVVSGEHLVANDFVGDYVLFLGDSWLGLLALELMVMPNYLLMALLEFGVVVSLELFVELEVAGSLEFFVSPVEVGSGRGAYRPCQEGGDLARKEVILLVVLVLEFFSFFGDDAGGVGYAESSQNTTLRRLCAEGDLARRAGAGVLLLLRGRCRRCGLC